MDTQEYLLLLLLLLEAQVVCVNFLWGWPGRCADAAHPCSDGIDVCTRAALPRHALRGAGGGGRGSCRWHGRRLFVGELQLDAVRLVGGTLLLVAHYAQLRRLVVQLMAPGAGPMVGLKVPAHPTQANERKRTNKVGLAGQQKRRAGSHSLFCHSRGDSG